MEPNLVTNVPAPQRWSLLARARKPNAAEFACVPWLPLLDATERGHVEAAMQVVDVRPGEFVCKIGRPAAYWLGLLDGLLKMSNDGSQGTTITFTGLPPGGWFGEGTALKREVYRYNIEPLRNSVIAGLPVESFHWLLERSIPFNRYLMTQLNERLSQFIAAREIDRLTDPDARVALTLAAMFHPVLYPGVGTLLRITQREMGYLVGLSRQRVNEALRSLQRRQLIRIEYGGVRVLDLAALRMQPGTDLGSRASRPH